MNLSRFFGEEKYDPKKVTRILVYPNITFSKNLEQDSYVQVLKNMIGELLKIRDDLFWYILSPEYIKSLDFANTVQYDWPLPTYPPAMRSHFNVPEFVKLIGNNIDIDIVMSHLPEHTYQVVNTLYNLTHHKPKVFGYCHWFDFENIVVWEKGSFNQNITGLLEYETCYINNQAQKDQVIKEAGRVFSVDTLINLTNILTVQHLGVNEKDIAPLINTNTEKIIVFNHRPDNYKHFPEFVSLMEKLWEQRQDFKVWIPLLAKPTHEWMTCEKLDKQGYYDKIRTCRIGFSPEQSYSGWSVSTTDGMMNGVPYIMYDAPYYKELWPDADVFSDDSKSLELLNKYLDDIHYRNKMGVLAIDYIGKNLLYKDRIKEMSDRIDEIVKSCFVINSKKLEELIEIIKAEGPLTKSELFKHCLWGRGIKWSPYRRGLLSHPNIYDQVGEEPKYIWRNK